MQERQSTNTSNTYYNLVSILYHSLQAAQTSAAYVHDAQQSGNQDLVRFFQQVQQQENQTANQARQLIDRLGPQSR